MTVELTFKIDLPGEETVIKSFTREVLRIGNDFRSQLQFPEAARSHGVLECVDHDNLTLLDLGSAIGILVNGERITKTLVRLGDVLQVGKGKASLIKTKIGEDERVYVPPTPKERIKNVVAVHDTSHALCLPKWFSPFPGFKFIDGDGDLVIVLGSGEFPEMEHVGAIKDEDLYEVRNVAAKLAAVALCQGRWHIWDLSLEDAEYWERSKPFEQTL